MKAIMSLTEMSDYHHVLQHRDLDKLILQKSLCENVFTKIWWAVPDLYLIENSVVGVEQ